MLFGHNVTNKVIASTPTNYEFKCVDTWWSNDMCFFVVDLQVQFYEGRIGSFHYHHLGKDG